MRESRARARPLINASGDDSFGRRATIRYISYFCDALAAPTNVAMINQASIETVETGPAIRILPQCCYSPAHPRESGSRYCYTGNNKSSI